MRRLSLFLFLVAGVSYAEETPIKQEWDYTQSMRRLAAQFDGKPGVILHIGDSITYANPYCSWAKSGEAHTPEDKKLLKWMHVGQKNNSDGWYLASFDHPDGGRSYTACSGIRVDELLKGGKQKLPSLEKILTQYTPQAVVLMIGTNDATADRRPKDFLADFEKAVDTIISKNAVPILSTIPPHVNKFQTAKEYNEGIRTIAKLKSLPLIDFESEILRRRGDNWNGTLMNEGDVHPRAEFNGTKSNSAPTAENLKNSGYLLRGWLSVRKIGEVKSNVFDHVVTAPKLGSLPKGTPIRLPVTRDTWISSVREEMNGSNGGSPKLKLKAYQEFSIIDVDPKPLLGKTIHAAFLHVKLAGPERLHRVGISSLAADWVEGKATSYGKETGVSTFKHRQYPGTPWSYPGSDICSVMFSEGGTLWGHAEASEPDGDGWQTIPVDLNVMRARIANISTGFVLFDDTGSEWTRDGENFQFRHFPNRYVHSRESGSKTAPWLEVFVSEKVIESPKGVRDIKVTDFPEGGIVVEWKSSAKGNQFLATELAINGKVLPLYRQPPAVSKNSFRQAILRDLNLPIDEEAKLELCEINEVGLRSAPRQLLFKQRPRVLKELPGKQSTFSSEIGDLPKLGTTPVAIIDELDKVHATEGTMIPSQSTNYLAANHLWNAKKNLVTLQAAQAEIVAFQVAFRGPIQKATPAIAFPTIPKLQVSFGQYQTVEGKSGSLPDPITPINDFFSIPSSPLKPKELFGSLHVELLIPKGTPSRVHEGSITISDGENQLKIPIELMVWNFSLPDKLSFIPDMNGYGLPADEYGYYRLAHRHRTVLNIVPYSQRGIVSDGWSPSIADGKLDFSEWDRRFGRFFDGSAFQDLPRSGVPLECFYLPLHENWPTSIHEHYNGNYWADDAFTKEYRANFVNATKQFGEHISAQKWNQTMFQVFFNNKVDFKRNGWSRASSPWLLDEPASFQDFWALKYFADATVEGRRSVDGLSPLNLAFRADISRPMWQRDTLKDRLTYNVVNGDWRNYQRMVLDRKTSDQRLIEYGSANEVESSNLQAVAWSIDAWSLGADGVLPWLTVGSGDAWRKAEVTCLFYPPRIGEKEPSPSVRLKAYRRGQQDVEYLVQLQKILNPNSRTETGSLIRNQLKLVAQKEGTGAPGEDAGVLKYEGIKPQDIWALRMRVGQAIHHAQNQK